MTRIVSKHVKFAFCKPIIMIYSSFLIEPEQNSVSIMLIIRFKISLSCSPAKLVCIHPRMMSDAIEVYVDRNDKDEILATNCGNDQYKGKIFFKKLNSAL